MPLVLPALLLYVSHSELVLLKVKPWYSNSTSSSRLHWSWGCNRWSLDILWLPAPAAARGEHAFTSWSSTSWIWWTSCTRWDIWQSSETIPFWGWVGTTRCIWKWTCILTNQQHSGQYTWVSRLPTAGSVYVERHISKCICQWGEWCNRANAASPAVVLTASATRCLWLLPIQPYKSHSAAATAAAVVRTKTVCIIILSSSKGWCTCLSTTSIATDKAQNYGNSYNSDINSYCVLLRWWTAT